MPKMKTHKGSKKRFKVTATGKVMRRRAGKGHLLSGKSSKRRRKLRKDAVVSDVSLAKVRRLMQE